MRFLLPYDGSAVARAALCHFTDAAHRRWSTGSLILVLAAGQRCAIQRRLAEARGLIGEDVPVSFRLLDRDDLPQALARLTRAISQPTFVSPLDLRGTTAWYQTVAGALLTGRYGTCVAIDHLPRVSASPLRGRVRPFASSAQPRHHRYICRAVRDTVGSRDAPRRLEG